jgi:hypothetical protein
MAGSWETLLGQYGHASAGVGNTASLREKVSSVTVRRKIAAISSVNPTLVKSCGMTREHPIGNTPSHDWLSGVTICPRHSSGNTMHDLAGANAEDLECGSLEIGRVINVFSD